MKFIEEWIETDELVILRDKIERLAKKGYWNAENFDTPLFDLSKIEPLGSYDIPIYRKER